MEVICASHGYERSRDATGAALLNFNCLLHTPILIISNES